MNRSMLYQNGVKILTEAGIAEAKMDMMILIEDICHITRNDLYVHGEEMVEDSYVSELLSAIEKRKQHVPVSQILGKQEFMGLTFQVNDNVLTPRQDTEILVEEVLKELHDGSKILDLCTGSGCILLSLLHYSNDCSGVGADISKKALAVAEKNSANLAIPAEWIESDLFYNVRGTFDIITANPPYIRSDVIPTLMEEVREHEPLLALDGKEDGCFFYQKIIEQSLSFLKGGGMLFFEIGYDQGEAISKMMMDKGYQGVKVVQDYAGLDRVVFGTYFGGNRNV